MQQFVVGIDPSLSRTAIAVCPLDWGGDWSKVAIKGFPTEPNGDGPAARMRRCNQIAADILGWLLYTPPLGLGSVRKHFFIEDYAFGQAFRAHHLGELGGILRSSLMVEHEVGIQSARKRLLGKAPRKGAKVAVYEALVAAGGKFLSLDESDAMCVCNYGLSELGGFCFVGGQ